MFLRLLILVLLLISTSCHELGRDVEVRVDVANGQESVLRNDDTDFDYIHDYNWAGILCTNDAPVLRTVSRQRNTQRVFDKRKWLPGTSFKFVFTNCLIKCYNNARQLYCHQSKSGRSLLHFLCKLSIWFCHFSTQTICLRFGNSQFVLTCSDVSICQTVSLCYLM